MAGAAEDGDVEDGVEGMLKELELEANGEQDTDGSNGGGGGGGGGAAKPTKINQVAPLMLEDGTAAEEKPSQYDPRAAEDFSGGGGGGVAESKGSSDDGGVAESKSAQSEVVMLKARVAKFRMQRNEAIQEKNKAHKTIQENHKTIQEKNDTIQEKDNTIERLVRWDFNPTRAEPSRPHSTRFNPLHPTSSHPRRPK